MDKGTEDNWVGEFLLNSPDPILRIGTEGTILYANRAGKSLLKVFKIQIGDKAPDEIRKTVRQVIIRKRSLQTELKTGEKIYSLVFTPLVTCKSVIVSAFETNYFKQTEEKILRKREYEALSQISNLSLKSSDFQTLLDQTLHLVESTLGVEYCSILKILPDGNFIFEAGIGWKPENIGRIIKKDSASRAGYTVLSSRPIFLEKLNRKNSLKTMGFEESQDIISGINVLVGSTEKPYGVLMAHSTKKKRFTHEDAYFLTATALIFSFVIQRNEVETALQDKVHFMRTLLDTIPAPVFYKNSEGIYQGCNELFAKMILGSSKEKIIGRSVYDLFEENSSELEEIYERMDKQLFQKGGSHTYETKVMCSDGIKRDFIFNKAVYKSFYGTVEGLIGVMLDITGRKNIEDQLQKSEERYRIIAEQTGQLIYDIDMKNGSVEWAGAITELTGYNNNEIKKLDYYDWLEHIHPEDYRRVQQTLKNCWNTGEKFNEEFRFKQKDGRYFCVKNKGVYLRDKEDCICRALGVMEDVTEIKQSSEKLRNREELYRSFLQNFKGISFKLKSDFSPLLMEGAVEEITGYTEDDFTSGRITLYDLIDPEDIHILKKGMEKMSLSPNSIVEHEYRLRQKDGSIKWIHELIHNVCNSSGETIFIQGYAYDITQRKKFEETLEKAEKIGMREIHHRIKNNLQVVSSLLSLQADKFNEQDVVEAFRESENRVISMSMIHEELYKSDDAASIDFAAYLKKLTADILRSYKTGDDKVRLILEVDSTLLGIDTAVPLGIIINELFSNSLKYAFPKGIEGIIRISLCQNEAECQKIDEISEKELTELPSSFTLTYSDNGACFPKKVDFKSPRTLGLQLVNALVEQINGTIELEKEKETKYTIRFEDKR